MSRRPCPRERMRYPSRLAAGARNFHHSNPRKLPTRRRNFLKPSWFPSILEPLGLRAQKALRLGARGVQTRSKTVDPDRAAESTGLEFTPPWPPFVRGGVDGLGSRCTAPGGQVRSVGLAADEEEATGAAATEPSPAVVNDPITVVPIDPITESLPPIPGHCVPDPVRPLGTACEGDQAGDEPTAVPLTAEDAVSKAEAEQTGASPLTVG